MPPRPSFLAIPLLALAIFHPAPVLATVPAGSVYQESGGVVVMEAERTPSSLGTGTHRWEVHEPGDVHYVHGAGDEAHLEFQGNSSNGGDPRTPLTYTFRIHQAGYYHLHLRGRARLDGQPEDKNNDCYVRVNGLDGATFGAGPNAGNSHMDDATVALLTSDTKMYGGLLNTWGWANLLDAGGSNNKRRPVYHFNANSTYRLTISGRSIKYNIDRIVFRRSTILETSAKSMAIPESSLSGGGNPSPSVSRIMLVDAETDRDLAELTPGAQINLATAGPKLNLRIDTFPPVVGSVRFEPAGGPLRNDNTVPYTIGGDNIGDDYRPWTPAPGNHSLTVTPFDTSGAPGTPLTIAFSVIDQLPAGSPVAQAGGDFTVVLPSPSAVLSGSGSDPGGSIASYVWHQTAGPAVATITGRNSASAQLGDLIQGSYRFRLTVTDNSGLSGFDDVTVTVSAAPGSPVVNAGIDKTISLPTSSATLNGSATDPANAIYFHLWNQISGPTQATRSGETTPNLTASGLVEGTYVFRLRVFSESGLVGADEASITVTAAAGIPIANAGPDQSIILPNSAVTLSGSGSDPGGTITAYAWSQISGPSNAGLTGSSSATLQATSLVAGTYVFRLTVTDNSGLQASDDAIVTVSAASGPPLVNAGTDKVITLPTSSAVLSGSASDPGGSIVSYAWSQVSGPNNAGLAGGSTPTLTASGLIQGLYRFRLTVTDNSGLSASDDALVTVNASGGSGQAVVTLMLVNATTDQDIGPVTDGMVINFSATGNQLNIRADTSPATVGSVRFAFNGNPNYETQSGKPYTIGGDTLTDYWPWTPPLGHHTLTATPFTGSGASGTAGTPLSVTFTVVDSGPTDGISGFSPPVVQRTAGNSIHLSFQGAPGFSYRFQRSINLGTWSTLETRAAGLDGAVDFTDVAPPAGNAFYRLQTP